MLSPNAWHSACNLIREFALLMCLVSVMKCSKLVLSQVVTRLYGNNLLPSCWSLYLATAYTCPGKSDDVGYHLTDSLGREQYM